MFDLAEDRFENNTTEVVNNEQSKMLNPHIPINSHLIAGEQPRHRSAERVTIKIAAKNTQFLNGGAKNIAAKT